MIPKYCVLMCLHCYNGVHAEVFMLIKIINAKWTSESMTAHIKDHIYLVIDVQRFILIMITFSIATEVSIHHKQ